MQPRRQRGKRYRYYVTKAGSTDPMRFPAGEIERTHLVDARDCRARGGGSERYVAQLIRLAFLSPELIEGVLAGTTRLRISSAEIARGVELPVDWEEQRRLMKV